MKTQFKLFVSVLALALVGVVVAEAHPARKLARQGAGRPLQAAAQRIRQLDRNLQLTDAQRQQIKEIRKSHAQELRALAPAERRAQGRATLLEMRKQVRGVLTPEQQAKFDTLRARGHRPGKARAEGKPAE